MLDSRRVAVLAAVCSLALPATALGQGAGDHQYEDPFAGEDRGAQDAGSSGSGGGGGAESAGGGSQGSEDSGDESPLSQTPPQSESRAARTATPAGELPRTGSDPCLVALLGLGFVLTGAGLRVRVRRPLA